jgi:hypothetical protein
MAQSEVFEPTTVTAMAVAVRIDEQAIRDLVEAYPLDALDYDEDYDCIVCAACEVRLEPWQVATHVQLKTHAEAIEAREGISTDGVPITLNGQPMLFDTSCIFPRTIFGAGRMLYDDTLGCLLTPDITGAVDLRANHEYTVVEFELLHAAPESQPLMTQPLRSMHYFSAEPRTKQAQLTTSMFHVKHESSATALLGQYWKRRQSELREETMAAAGKGTVRKDESRRTRRLRARQRNLSLATAFEGVQHEEPPQAAL